MKKKDPVCGMEVDPAKSKHKATHHQKQYNFCCQQCLDTFKKHPDKFAK